MVTMKLMAIETAVIIMGHVVHVSVLPVSPLWQVSLLSGTGMPCRPGVLTVASL